MPACASTQNSSQVDTTRINDLIDGARNQLRTNINIADSLARAAYALLPPSGYDTQRVQCLILLSYCNGRAGSSTEGFSQCRRAIALSEALGDKSLLSRAYNQLYLLYFQEGTYDSATLAAERSLSLAGEVGLTAMLARGHQNFGILASVRGNHANAAPFPGRCDGIFVLLHRG